MSPIDGGGDVQSLSPPKERSITRRVAGPRGASYRRTAQRSCQATMPSVRQPGGVRVEISVVGYLPPAKGEAKSMLADGHSQRERVLQLLEAARIVMADREVFTGDLRIEVTVDAPRSHRLPDATNLLGGIGDVLQARPTGADVQHLGLLANVACFRDDAQIQQINYERLDVGEVGYRITIQQLER